MRRTTPRHALLAIAIGADTRTEYGAIIPALRTRGEGAPP